MADFQAKFFPDIATQTVDQRQALAAAPVKAAYCKYNNQVLQLVVSSLYLSALFSGIIASKFARLYGRKVHFYVLLWLHHVDHQKWFYIVDVETLVLMA